MSHEEAAPHAPWIAEWTAPGHLSFEDDQFEGVVLRDGRLEDVFFYDCTFRGCSLQQTHFTSCRFLDCTFEECDLAAIRVPDSTFRGGSMKDCKVLGVDFTECADFGLDGFNACQLDHCSFIGQIIPKLRIVDCSARSLHCEDARLPEADLRGTDFQDARFSRADLRKADLRRARNYVIDPRVTRMDGVRCSLPEAVGLLRGLDLRLE